ncbi:MAG: PP2C family protein-serine/threonine phosphatase [Lachnospiraceae bacterium]|nr:PP2C family protein-serine/threonine phosphatase [Lachnospiraceae bacterium]
MEEAVMHLDIFRANEEKANQYTSFCTLIAAAVVALMWLLNLCGFFIVDQHLMNIAMPAGVALFLMPSLLTRTWKDKKNVWLLKYFIMCCFIIGIAILNSALTIQLVLAWSCPVILSCHYYSPKFTHFTLIGVLLCMLCATYIGLYCGVWDANMMRALDLPGDAAFRAEFIREATAAGDNLLLRVFNFYYFPRAAIVIVVYLISVTLSKRTHGLLKKQEKDNREKERIGAELNVATRIQASMLPCVFPAFPEYEEFDIYASMDPAKEIGGDFYDFFLVDADHLALVMADVSGKGVPAALFMMITKTLLKNAAQSGLSSGAVLETVNNQLLENNEAGMFVTVWLGIYEISTGRLTAANAGHEYPAIKRAGGSFTLLKDRHGFVMAGMEDVKYQEYELNLQAGDILFLYTDGVPEATDGEERFYGTDRMLEALNRNENVDSRELLLGVREDIDQFVGETEQFDDITMMALQVRR